MDRLSNAGTVRTNSVERRTDAPLTPGDEIFHSADDQFYGGLNAGNDGIFGTLDDFYATTADPNIAMNGGHVDADADNNKDLLNTENGLENFSVVDFVDYIQTLANVRAVNGGTQSRLVYANRMLEETEINLGAATSRIMDADMAYESTKMAQQNVLLQAGASMVTQANHCPTSLAYFNKIRPVSSIIKDLTIREDYEVSTERKMIGLPAQAHSVPRYRLTTVPGAPPPCCQDHERNQSNQKRTWQEADSKPQKPPCTESKYKIRSKRPRLETDCFHHTQNKCHSPIAGFKKTSGVRGTFNSLPLVLLRSESLHAGRAISNLIR